MSKMIDCLGFGAWAGNVIVNYLEDYTEVMQNSVKGSHVVEKDDYSMNASWEDKVLCISIRAYVEGKGWQVLEQHIKLK